jgi:hypothetical protein
VRAGAACRWQQVPCRVRSWQVQKLSLGLKYTFLPLSASAVQVQMPEVASTWMRPCASRCAAAAPRSVGVNPITRPAALMCTHVLPPALHCRWGWGGCEGGPDCSPCPPFPLSCPLPSMFAAGHHNLPASQTLTAQLTSVRAPTAEVA